MRHRSSATTLKPEMTDEELSGLKGWIQEANLEGMHLEIGTAAGGTLCFMMNCYDVRERPRFAVVDTMSYFPDQFDIVKRNLVDNSLDPESIDYRIMTSNEAFFLAEKSGERFDFILIDASHKIRYVMADLRWTRLLNIGGLVCLHDYTEKFKGVRWAVDRFLRRNPHFSRAGQAGSLLCVRKDDHTACPEITFLDRVWGFLWSPFLQLESSLRKRLGQTNE